jgi:hypothetical protein
MKVYNFRAPSGVVRNWILDDHTTRIDSRPAVGPKRSGDYIHELGIATAGLTFQTGDVAVAVIVLARGALHILEELAERVSFCAF